MAVSIPAPPAAAPPQRPPKRGLRWAGVALAALGYWLSFNLLLLGLGNHALDPWLRSQCGAEGQTANFDCLSVLNSGWAYLDISKLGIPISVGLPIAALGMAYFAFIGIWNLFVGPPTRGRAAWHLVPLLVVGIGAFVSLGFLQVMAVALRRWCAGCLAAHAVNGGLVLLTLLAIPWRRPATPAAPHPPARLALATLCAGGFLFLLNAAVVLFLIAAFAGGQMRDRYLEIINDPQYARWQYERQTPAAIPFAEAEAWDGAPDAPHTVAAFIDLQCEHCRTAHEMLRELLKKYPGQLRVAYRHSPQNATCNPHVKGARHPAACRAAAATEAARAVGGADAFLKMLALLYQRQRELEFNLYADWARDVGLESAAFVEQLDSPAVAERVRADADLGARLGVKAVPTLFLDGRRFDSWRSLKAWEEILRPVAASPP